MVRYPYWECIACATVMIGVAFPSVVRADATADSIRRSALSEKGRKIFRDTKNHCHSFRDIAAEAVAQSKLTGEVLEDLKYVLIGQDLRKRRTPPYYIGNEKGATGDIGFKASLRDGSPQVEHAMAAIYVGKFLPPGSTEAAAILTEFAVPLATNGKINAADMLLWSIGGDVGQRLSDKELEKLPKVIERTMCGD